MKPVVDIFWFRRDLRVKDNAGLYQALKGQYPVLPLFVFDRNILEGLENKTDRRVEFIDQQLKLLQRQFASVESAILIRYGTPTEIFSQLSEHYDIRAVLCNEDYEPYARERDRVISDMMQAKGIPFHSFKDQVIFSRDEVLRGDGSPYTIFTPYSKKWLALLRPFYLRAYPVEQYLSNLFKFKPPESPSLKYMGFTSSGDPFPPEDPGEALIRHYGKQRDYPGLDATSHLGIHLRFGTISIRQLATEAATLSPVLLNELIWRDFYQMILWHFPKVGKGRAFKPAYEYINWRNNEKEFAKWCAGETGYPMVDAGMRQLHETGFMHNRVRMITASFLAKHLLIDWRWGEAYFAAKLLDYDLASNNGGWQWAAGCGCDAAPYFRVFNPTLQQKKFDPDGTYVKRWVPEIAEMNYPQPMVEHVFARNRAIAAYKKALQTSSNTSTAFLPSSPRPRE
ncbi:MAG: deoxyribodipyrimidine photo-lyase [Bacteroidota bacterium]|nr:deoxyribodipyrimidine photo-lyase [Bacteroidota bacterium]